MKPITPKDIQDVKDFVPYAIALYGLCLVLIIWGLSKLVLDYRETRRLKKQKTRD